MMSIEYMCQLNRRIFIGAALSGAALLGAKPALAQQVKFPDLGETLSLLESSGGVRLIYVRFSLAFSLTLDLAVRSHGEQIQQLEAAAELQVLPAERHDTVDLFRTITELSNQEQRGLVLTNLKEFGDPLEDGRGEKLAELLTNVAEGLSSWGVSVEEEPISDSLSACWHVERIAAVTRDAPQSSSFICGYFPFTVFC